MAIHPEPEAAEANGSVGVTIPSKPGLRACVRADIALVRSRRDQRLVPYLFPNLFAVLMYRLAHAVGPRGAGLPARALSIVGQLMTGAELDWRAQLGPGVFLEHPVGVVVGDGVVSGANLVLGAGVLLGSTANESLGRPRSGFPTLGSDIFIWAKASIIGPVRIGDAAMIGAHALVLDDVPAGAVARGVPARSYLDGQRVNGGRPAEGQRPAT